MNRSEEDIPLILKDWLIEQGCWDEYLYKFLNDGLYVKGEFQLNKAIIRYISWYEDYDGSLDFWYEINCKWTRYYDSL